MITGQYFAKLKQHSTACFVFQNATFETNEVRSIFQRIPRRQPYHDKMVSAKHVQNLLEGEREIYRRLLRIHDAFDCPEPEDSLFGLRIFSFSDVKCFFREDLYQELIHIRCTYGNINDVKWELVYRWPNPLITVRHGTRGWLIGAIVGKY